MAFDYLSYLKEPRWLNVRLGLERIQGLLKLLGRPQDRLRFVHVAGTNGKGSVCAYTSSILQKAGYKVGMLTSPYIERLEEQMQINGECIDGRDLSEVTLKIKEAADAMPEHPTEFELICAASLLWFAQNNCDIVVLEVGLGGRLDATNVIESPEVCVITRMGLDHTDYLGSTIEAIAEEKAGIIKEGSTVVTCSQTKEVLSVLRSVAAQRHATLKVCEDEQIVPCDFQLNRGQCSSNGQALPMRTFSYGGTSFETALLASYQPYNAALAIEAAYALRDKGWSITDRALKEGIAVARWPGRFEVVGKNPLTIVDGGHNSQGAQVLVSTLNDVLPGEKCVFVMGVLADKDYVSMVDTVAPMSDTFVVSTPDNPRALEAKTLANVIVKAWDTLGCSEGKRVVCTSSGVQALTTAREIAGKQGVVCAFGSLYALKDYREAMRQYEGATD
ncbi:folylpolyglutamate synthase/dihydrofolate synthase family protein [Adlercreutzia sp. ZJ138]|uniref:bifunctional folylpolyglutamate synthase/dihydrofolate synthase n=1 Tax=Adlercreutzia sp. ZJ138 TaxID=2709405 RepID=UPI0013EB443C|nr:folylpolyglutamate synthase/dihydrofolate synthase family protein [Adlercreutzia sp. ZJ138]